jgi:hypothetical protein
VTDELPPRVAEHLGRETVWNNLAVQAKQELRRQHEKWGEQNHPDGTGDDRLVLAGLRTHRSARPLTVDDTTAGTFAFLAKHATDRLAAGGHVQWSDILLEEVFEALAENEPAMLRNELIQVAAVALQWAGAIDRRAV